mmetsp:Transcript_31155/g.48800  ORF Transcript_31155/g.48800 Transcript_31155/m.48800 type:complete len:105 (+) Transcript_31155:214-528(+)
MDGTTILRETGMMQKLRQGRGTRAVAQGFRVQDSGIRVQDLRFKAGHSRNRTGKLWQSQPAISAEDPEGLSGSPPLPAQAWQYAWHSQWLSDGSFYSRSTMTDQ